MTNTVRNSRRVALVALTVVVALAATACSSSSKKSSSGSTATTVAAGKADPKGVIKVGLDLLRQSGGGGGLTFDPMKATGANGAVDDGTWYLIYGRFMRKNADGTLTPDLAKSATIVDTKTIDVVLRDGLTFSDGTPLDATAVKASLDRALANRKTIEATFQQRFFSLASVTVKSPTTVELSLPDGTAAAWYDQYITGFQTTITKPGQTDFSNPIGAGPMKLVSNQPLQRITLAKNDKFWNAAAVKVAGYDFVHVDASQAQSGIAALRTGQLDVVQSDPAQIPSLTGSLKTYSLVSPDQIVSLHICKKDGPLADVRVRKAINKAIDRAAINKAVYAGTSQPATEIYPTGHKFNVPSLDKELAYDPAGAKALLKDAGFANGLSLDLYFIPFFGLQQTAEVMQQELKAVGITLNVKAGANYVSEFLQAGPPAIGLYPGSSSGIDKLSAWSGTGLGNVCKYDNPDFNALRTKLASVSQNSPEAADLWRQIEKFVIDNALGGFVLFRSALGAYNTDRVGNMSGWPSGSWIIPDPYKTFVKAK